MTRIAVISDIHFGKDARSEELMLPGTISNGSVKNAQSIIEGAINIIKKNEVEYLFIAGDLTSLGKPEEFHFCEKMILDLAEKSGIDKTKIFWCVGNHDNDWAITGIFDNEYHGNTEIGMSEEVLNVAQEKYDALAAVVAREHMNNKPCFEKMGKLPISGVHEDENMVLFVLNSSSNCVRKQICEHGELTVPQLDWLKEQLEEYKNSNKWKVIMMHHHPFCYPFPTVGMDISLLTEGSELCELAGENGIDLIVHGHRHQPRCQTEQRANWNKPITFLCSGSFSVGEDQRCKGDIPNCFHIIELTDEIGEMELLTYEYSVGSGWNRLSKYSKETPLDSKMRFGRIFPKEEIDNAVDTLFDFGETVKLWKWDELPTPLTYRSSIELNKMLQEKNELFDIKLHPMEDILIIKKNYEV